MILLEALIVGALLAVLGAFVYLLIHNIIEYFKGH